MTVHRDHPAERSAEIHVLFEGYADLGVTPFSVASTVTYVQDGDARLIIDPGFVPSHRSILDPLEGLGVDPGTITDVVLSHHHPDHTLNIALFPNARVHDYWAIYKGDTWEARPAEGFHVSPSVRLIQTPGHTPQCITTLAGTAEGVTAFTHLWLFAAGPAEDPLAVDPVGLHAGRARVLEIATTIVPGHGAAFVPDFSTPR